jgi:hypothetical protein
MKTNLFSAKVSAACSPPGLDRSLHTQVDQVSQGIFVSDNQRQTLIQQPQNQGTLLLKETALETSMDNFR